MKSDASHALHGEFELYRAEIANFKEMFDRRLRWQTRMIVGTAIVSVAVSSVLSHL